MKKSIIILVIYSLVLLIVGYSIAWLQADYQWSEYAIEEFEKGIDSGKLTAREHYYRALYDACRVTDKSSQVCLRLVEILVQANWYEEYSNGWIWPIGGKQI